MMGMKTGTRLGRYRKALGLSLREASRQLQASHQALMLWESNEQTPSAPFRAAIEVWTGGDIKNTDWPLSERERSIVENAARVRAATPTGTDG